MTRVRWPSYSSRDTGPATGVAALNALWPVRRGPCVSPQPSSVPSSNRRASCTVDVRTRARCGMACSIACGRRTSSRRPDSAPPVGTPARAIAPSRRRAPSLHARALARRATIDGHRALVSRASRPVRGPRVVRVPGVSSGAVSRACMGYRQAPAVVRQFEHPPRDARDVTRNRAHRGPSQPRHVP